MNLTARPFDGPADLRRMIALADALRAKGQTVYPIAADLYEELADPAAQASARLWEADGQLTGFAYLSAFDNMVDVFEESAFTAMVRREMLDWLACAARARAQAGEPGQPPVIDASALENDRPRCAFLEDAGFTRQEETSLLYARSLLDIPRPQLPAGFRIRPLAGLDELDAYVELHRAAFGTQNMTRAYRQAIMSTPGYLPELDLVAVAADGSLAGFCVCQIFADDAPRAGGTQEGWTDPLGVHPAWRRLGLASALILTGMELLRQRGLDTALLGTSSTNSAMRALAETLGFRVATQTVWYSKKLSI